MAGFDAAFRVSPRDVPLVRACFAAIRLRVRKLGVRVAARSLEDGAYIEFSGQTYALDILLERLRRDLPTIAEATQSERAPSARRRTANGLVEILNRYRGMMYDRYDEDWIPTLRGRSVPVTGVIHDLFPRDAPHLVDRLMVTMDLLASWHFDEVAPEVLLEEIHTAAELMLKSLGLVGAKRMSFAELVDSAHAAELIRDDARETLMTMKTTRARVKHRGSSDAREWLDTHFWDAAAALEVLSAEVRVVAEAGERR